jgi:hypothetical protein
MGAAPVELLAGPASIGAATVSAATGSGVADNINP